MKIFAEQFPEQPARRDKSFPVVREMESVRPRFLFQRKRRFQSAEGIRIAVQRRLPNVDPVPDLLPFHHRHGDSRPPGTPISRLAFPGQPESTWRAKSARKHEPL